MNELVTFFAYLFLNPIWYLAFIVIYALSTRRIQKERESFHTRVYSQVSDFTIPFLPSLVVGAVLSLLTIGVGVVMPKVLFICLIIVTIVTALSLQVRWMTPLYSVGVLLLLYPFTPLVERVLPFDGFSHIPIERVALLLVVFTFVEALLIRWNAVKYTSPRLERSKRGKWIGVHAAQRLWVIPVFFFIPEGSLPSLGAWPLLPFGDEGLQPIVFPFLLGFKQTVAAELPKRALSSTSTYVFYLGIALALLSALAFYAPLMASIVGAVAIIAREAISFFVKRRDEAKRPFFSSRRDGCIVLGVLPGSPAEKLNIEAGETIVKVNGQAVNSEKSFYYALQKNAAFCKLEILTSDGQTRLAQAALYDDAHHQLGVLLVKDDVHLQDSVV